MGRFIISRTSRGVRFSLQTESGYTLAVSKDYATLDACKKGICALVQCAFAAPVLDTAQGTRSANPKFEITEGESGFLCIFRAPNGKRVLEREMRTRKACLRAITMVRRAVCDAAILYDNGSALAPLTVGRLTQART